MEVFVLKPHSGNSNFSALGRVQGSRFAGTICAALALLGLVSRPLPATAQSYTQPLGTSVLTSQPDVHFDQKVNTQLPLDLNFQDETGKAVRLKDYFDGTHPVILVLPFYRCTSGCTLELQGMAHAFNQMKYRIGTDFKVVTISINPKENAPLATTHKRVYMKMLTVPADPNGWHFLTGAQASIQDLTKAIGFHYVFNLETQQFIHPNGIVILTPSGKTYRYFLNTVFEPNDLRIALTKASDNQIGSVFDQAVSLCCDYNPMTGHYGLVIQRVIVFSCSLTVVLLAGFIFLMLRWEKRTARIPLASSQDVTLGPHQV